MTTTKYTAHVSIDAFATNDDALDAFAFACATANVHLDARPVVASRSDRTARVAFDATRHDAYLLIHDARLRLTRA